MRIEIDKEKCTGCKDCETACSQHHYGVDDHEKSAIRISEDDPEPGSYTPNTCDQCGDCEAVCMSDAMQKKEGDRYVIDPDACVFCLLCVDECKKKVLYFHDDIDTPIKCDLCLKCTEVCESGALTAVE